MITVCDPICKGLSHEKVNSGLIYGLSLAFPKEKIRFYASASHIDAIKKIIDHDKVPIREIEYRPIRFGSYPAVVNIVLFCFLLSRIFSETQRSGADRLFFLSFTPEILFSIKKLKNINIFSQLKFTFILHAAFEAIADDLPLSSPIILPRNKIPLPNKKGWWLDKLRRTKPTEFPVKIYRKLVSKLPKFSFGRHRDEFFTVKNMMEWRHSDDFRYVALSPHITENAGNYLDLNKFYLYTIILPTVFNAPVVPAENDVVKFAIFGYGDSLVLHNILYKLSQRKLTRPYEIRIIGSDARGTEDFPNVICTSKGKRMERSEMEKQAKDVDVFLILYDKTRYRLSCSASILEALSMVKPVIHFDNDCINQFNKKDNPIGYCCNSLGEYVDKLEDIIQNYSAYKLSFLRFRKNILSLREQCSIDKFVPILRDSFNWVD